MKLAWKDGSYVGRGRQSCLKVLGCKSELRGLGSLDELAEPFETILIACTPDHAAHEKLDGAGTLVARRRILAIGLVKLQAEELAQLVLLERLLFVDFVPEDHEWYIG